MSNPYVFLEGQSPKFFDEGAEFKGENIDLLSFSLETEDSFGMDERILAGAREVLGDVSPAFARAILWFADATLEGFLQVIKVKSDDGDDLDSVDLDFRRLNQLDFIHLILHGLGKDQLLIGDEAAGLESKQVTPAMFCAAYALRMLFNGTRDYLRDSDLRNYYRMQASAAYGLMQALNLSADTQISAAVMTALRTDTAKKGATAKLANDPTQAAKAYAIKIWPEAKRRGLSALAFHGRLTDCGHKVAPDTVRKWVTKLRKSGTC